MDLEILNIEALYWSVCSRCVRSKSDAAGYALQCESFSSGLPQCLNQLEARPKCFLCVPVCSCVASGWAAKFEFPNF